MKHNLLKVKFFKKWCEEKTTPFIREKRVVGQLGSEWLPSLVLPVNI